jgi:hypothetical protein
MMYDEKNQYDALQFDRLVDGELSSEERRQLLLSLDGRPGGWRRCALAFLEAQAWRADLERVVREVDDVPNGRVASETLFKQWTKRRGAQWLAVAAGLMIAFGLGSAWRPANEAGAPTIADGSTTAVDRIVRADAPDQPTATPAGGSRDALTLWIHDAAGAARRVEVPLVDAGALDRQLGVQFRSGIPEALRRQLQQGGFAVETQRRYAPLWIEDSGSLVLPVEDTRIVPISPAVF